VDLAAKRKALAADGCVGMEFSARVVDGSGEPTDLMAMFPTEAASPAFLFRRHRVEATQGGLFASSRVDDRCRHRHARLADIDGGARDELSRLPLWSAAEGAGQLERCAIPSPPSTRTSCCFDDLVDALVAELESFGEFAKRCTAQMEATNGAVELGPSDLGIVLRLNQALFSLPGFR
jgi:hypothetical protein